MKCKYLVAAALPEELAEFLALFSDGTQQQLEEGVIKLTPKFDTGEVEILAFSTKKMGMPYNAAKLMEIIKVFEPRVTLFIGICAIFQDSGHDLGTVLIPHKVFSYESGKIKEGIFFPDYYSYDTSDNLREQAHYLQSKLTLTYKVSTDEDFCSGAVVINDQDKVQELEKGVKGGRKVTGLDMEAYSIACINQILRSKTELLVIKGASDFAKRKDESESEGKREVAKKNAAGFALQLIMHLERISYIRMPKGELEIVVSAKEEPNPTATYKLKVVFNITNKYEDPIVLKSKFFKFRDTLNSIGASAGKHVKPLMKDGYNKVGEKCEDNYKDMVIIQPNQSVLSCWLPINPSIAIEDLRNLVQKRKVGSWEYEYYLLKREGEMHIYKQEI